MFILLLLQQKSVVRKLRSLDQRCQLKFINSSYASLKQKCTLDVQDNNNKLSNSSILFFHVRQICQSMLDQNDVWMKLFICYPLLF